MRIPHKECTFDGPLVFLLTSSAIVSLRAQTNSDIIMQDIYRMLAEIEIEIEKNLTPKNKLAKSDTFGLTNILQDLPPATKSPVRNANAEPKPQINTKPKPLLPAH